MLELLANRQADAAPQFHNVPFEMVVRESSRLAG